MTELYTASNELFKRPDDECFPTMEALYQHVLDRSFKDMELAINVKEDAQFIKSDDTLGLNLKGYPVDLSQFSAEQFCADLKIPFNYVNGLPQDIALENFNHGLKTFSRDEESIILMNSGEGNPIIRAVTSERYARIYDHEVVKRLMDLPDNWNIAPTWEGDDKGLYAGDRDMFVFLIDGGSYVTDGFGDKGIHRGFFVRNSEVRASSLEITTFLHRGVCGNHIVWGAENVIEKRIRHVGDALEQFQEAMADLHRFTQSSGKEEEEKIRVVMNTKLGNDKDETVEAVRKMFRNTVIGKKDLERSWDLADQFEELPNMAWGMAQGITRLSQEKYPNHQNKRSQLDRVSGRILDKVLS